MVGLPDSSLARRVPIDRYRALSGASLSTQQQDTHLSCDASRPCGERRRRDFLPDGRLVWQRSTELRSHLHLEPPPDPEEPAIDAMRDIPPDRLWGAQPGLVDRAVDNLSSRLPGRSNVYAMGVAADGTQQLFAREARLALKVA